MKNTHMAIAASAMCAAVAFVAAAAEVKVDFSKETGPVKRVNGVGQPPLVGKLGDWSMMHYLKEAGVPYSRLHDVGGWLGGGMFVDIPNLFPDFDAELDLMDPAAVRAFYEAERPDVAVIAAARVGGIGANSAANSRFLYENELIALNTVWGAAEAGVKRLLFLGSTCIYPRLAPQPIPETALLTSELEKTNEGYALAKISGLKLCEFLRRERGLVYHSLMPTNLYGPGDNYDIEHGHVLPTMIRKFEMARVGNEQTVNLWGSGSPLREFLHVDDLAAACLFLLEMENPPDLVNVGSGREVTIRQLAEMVKEATGCKAFIAWDRTKPDGTPRKLCDTSLIRSLGWEPQIDLATGLRRTVDEYRAELASGRIRL